MVVASRLVVLHLVGAASVVQACDPGSGSGLSGPPLPSVTSVAATADGVAADGPAPCLPRTGQDAPDARGNVRVYFSGLDADPGAAWDTQPPSGDAALRWNATGAMEAGPGMPTAMRILPAPASSLDHEVAFDARPLGPRGSTAGFTLRLLSLDGNGTLFETDHVLSVRFGPAGNSSANGTRSFLSDGEVHRFSYVWEHGWNHLDVDGEQASVDIVDHSSYDWTRRPCVMFALAGPEDPAAHAVAIDNVEVRSAPCPACLAADAGGAQGDAPVEPAAAIPAPSEPAAAGGEPCRSRGQDAPLPAWLAVAALAWAVARRVSSRSR